ncbi:IPT/TIG domain-containing protein, partial [Pseudomonadota bacterium]
MNKPILSALAIVYVLIWSSGSYAQPVITSVGPPSGGIGTVVTIHGTNFVNTTAVSFNEVSAANYNVVGGGTVINAEVAAGTTTGPVTITATDGTATSTMDFVVSDIPKITRVDPPSGGIGTVVTIHGINFVNTTAVSFNGIAAAIYSVVSAGTAIIAEVAVDTTTGPITITTADGTVTSTKDFVFSDVPTITSFDPPSGGVGTLVTIHGANFANATAVFFNNVPAANYSDIGGGAVIVAEVAAGTTTGPVTITATDGTATSAMDFVFSDSPTINS